MSRAIERIRAALREPPARPTADASEGNGPEPIHASAEGMADAVMEMCRTLAEPRKSIVHLLRAWKAAVPLRPDAASLSATEDEACEICGERRATVHLEGAVNELCVECHVERLERIANGPVGEMRRLLASFVQRVGDQCRVDADGYCQSHFLERGDQCTVKRARDVFALAAAPRDAGREEKLPDLSFVTGDLLLDCQACVNQGPNEGFYDAMARDLRERIVRIAARRGATG